MTCLSRNVMPGSGRVSSEEPPPDKRHSTLSPEDRPPTSARSLFDAATLRSSGTGCGASSTSMNMQATSCPGGTMTAPLNGGPQCRSISRAMAAAALPAPITTGSPTGRRGNQSGMQFAGVAASTAASKSDRSRRSASIIRPAAFRPP